MEERLNGKKDQVKTLGVDLFMSLFISAALLYLIDNISPAAVSRFISLPIMIGSALVVALLLIIISASEANKVKQKIAALVVVFSAVVLFFMTGLSFLGGLAVSAVFFVIMALLLVGNFGNHQGQNQA